MVRLSGVNVVTTSHKKMAMQHSLKKSLNHYKKSGSDKYKCLGLPFFNEVHVNSFNGR